MRLAGRFIAAFCACAALLTAAAALQARSAARLGAMGSLQSAAMACAHSAALAIDPAEHARAAAAMKWDDPAYRSIEARLRALRDAWKASGVPVRFVFTMVPDDRARSGAVYVVDAAEPGPEKSKPGEELTFFRRSEGTIAWKGPIALEYTDAYGSYVSGFAPIVGADGRALLIAGVDMDASAVSAQANGDAISAALPLVPFAALLAGAFAVFAHRTARPIAAAAATAERIADGDRAGPAADEAARIGAALESVSKSLRSVDERASAADARSGEVRDRLVPRAAQLRTDADDAAQRIADAARRVREAASHGSSTAGEARTAETEARGAVDCGANALGDLAHIDAGVQAVIVRGRDLADHLAQMRERAATVDAALEAVVQVANRSSVLSLNAEIEASQAGEAGRGFAVVAREIRRLAEQAASNSLEIERNVRALHEAVEAGGRATAEFATAAEEASARSARLSASMADGIQRMQAVVPLLRTLADRGDAVRRESETAEQALRPAQQAAEAVAAYLEQVGPLVEEIRAQAAEVRAAAHVRAGGEPRA